jgi:hypothetical protein
MGDEGMTISDGKVGPGDTIHVLDNPARVVRRIGPDGQMVGDVALMFPDRVDTFTPLKDGRLFAVTGATAAPLVIIDGRDSAVERQQMPWQHFDQLQPLARQAIAIASEPSDGVVVAFVFSDYALVSHPPFADSNIIRLVDAATFPSVIVTRSRTTTSAKLGRAAHVVRSLAVADGILHVLVSRADTLRRGAVVDRYSVKGGYYIESWRLPGPVFAIAAHGGKVYAVTPQHVLTVRASSAAF